jgi:hypothetical protein
MVKPVEPVSPTLKTGEGKSFIERMERGMKNSDPETKKILIEVRWNNWEETNSPEKERKVFNYSDRELSNFHLLNPKDIVESENDEEEDKNSWADNNSGLYP